MNEYLLELLKKYSKHNYGNYIWKNAGFSESYYGFII